jgi:diguanylate cyclase
MGIPLRVLVIEDSEEDTLLLLHALRRGGYEVMFERVDTPAAMTAALKKQAWDIVLSDHSMPHLDANTALNLLKKSGFDCPFIIVSGDMPEEAAVAAMRLGAQDYVMKGNLTRLCAAIEREMKEAEVRRMGARAEEMFRHQAHYDPLTDLPNRTMFQDHLTLTLSHANRFHKMLAVLFVDLDRFKTIVDTLGHAVGDQLLRAVAQRLKGCLEDGYTLARLGGDEFVILLPEITRADKAVKLAHTLLELLKPAFQFSAQELHVTASIGISLYPYDGEDAETLLKNADTALYRAKEQGRNNYQLYTPAMNARAFERLALENSLRKALERKEFLLHYQPQVDVRTGMIVGAEALIRWQHPDLGIVHPSEFIPLAEETGLIVPLGEWVLKTACTQAKAWQEAGLAPFTMAVNLSARQFLQHDLTDIIARTLSETGLGAQWLEIEITESVAMQNADYTIVILRDLKEMGVLISMDDFGTGYSSLSYLKKFPINTLKMDQSFVRDIVTDASDAAIANAVIILAHSLGLGVVAEGVETLEQEKFLREHQCDRIQGFLYSTAVAPPHFETLLREWIQKTA